MSTEFQLQQQYAFCAPAYVSLLTDQEPSIWRAIILSWQYSQVTEIIPLVWHFFFFFLHLCICPFLISARHEPGQKVPSPKSCTQMTKIRTHKLLLEKCPCFNALRLLCRSCLDSVFPNVWGFYRCLCITDNCHLLIDCTLPKYFKLSACILVPFILSASLSAECFILPYFSCGTFYDSSSLHQNKASGLKQGSALWLNISF